MKPHKHAELIKQWADGAEIEMRYWSTEGWGEWYKTAEPAFYKGVEYEYRIKPELKPDVVCFSDVRYEKDYEEIEWQENETEYMSNLKLTFDGETGKLKSAEVLK